MKPLSPRVIVLYIKTTDLSQQVKSNPVLIVQTNKDAATTVVTIFVASTSQLTEKISARQHSTLRRLSSKIKGYSHVECFSLRRVIFTCRHRPNSTHSSPFNWMHHSMPLSRRNVTTFSTKGLNDAALPCTVRLYPKTKTSGNNTQIGGSSTSQTNAATTANSFATPNNKRAKSANMNGNQYD